MTEWSSGFPYFPQFKSEFCNKEFVIWVTVSFWSCFWWLYIQLYLLPGLAAHFPPHLHLMLPSYHQPNPPHLLLLGSSELPVSSPPPHSLCANSAFRLKCLAWYLHGWLSGKEPGWFNPWVRKIPLETEMATHSSILVWRIPWPEEPGRLQSMGSQRVGHNWMTVLCGFQLKRSLLVKATFNPHA